MALQKNELLFCLHQLPKKQLQYNFYSKNKKNISISHVSKLFTAINVIERGFNFFLHWLGDHVVMVAVDGVPMSIDDSDAWSGAGDDVDSLPGAASVQL